MSPKLTDYSRNVFSQFGEDGIIEKVFSIIGTRGRTCIEFGAWDGLHHSNTANLWKNGWRALLIECDTIRYRELLRNTRGYDCTCLNRRVDFVGSDALDVLSQEIGFGPDIDLLSIDIDGDDYFILDSLQNIKPRVVVCEFNPTMPPHLDLIGDPGSRMGCSALALSRLASQKGYSLIAATDTNCMFVRSEEFQKFSSFETALERIFPDRWLTNLITDYDGNYALTQRPPYGLRQALKPHLQSGLLFAFPESGIRLVLKKIYRRLREPYGKIRKHAGYVFWRLGIRGNRMPHRVKQNMLKTMAKLYKAKVFVESGTYHGDMVAAMRHNFSTIHSIEIDPLLCAQAKKRFSSSSNITIHCGDSSSTLPQIISRITEPALFWLDGHYSGGITGRGTKDTPIRTELEVIAKSGVSGHVIVIDDAQCFDGTHDYPTLSEVRSFVQKHWPKYDLIVESNMICITPEHKNI